MFARRLSRNRIEDVLSIGQSISESPQYECDQALECVQLKLSLQGESSGEKV